MSEQRQCQQAMDLEHMALIWPSSSQLRAEAGPAGSR